MGALGLDGLEGFRDRADRLDDLRRELVDLLLAFVFEPEDFTAGVFFAGDLAVVEVFFVEEVRLVLASTA